MTDVSRLKSLAAAISKQSPAIRAYAISQANVSVSQEADLVGLHEDLAGLNTRIANLEADMLKLKGGSSWNWEVADYHYYNLTVGDTSVTGCKNRFEEGDEDNWWVPGNPEPPTSPYTNFSDDGGIHPFTDAQLGPALKVRVTDDMGYWGTGPKGIYQYDSRTASFRDTNPSYFSRGNVYRIEWGWRWLSANNPDGWDAVGTKEGFLTACEVSNVANVSHHCYIEGSGTSLYFRASRNTAHNTWSHTYSNASGITFTADTWHKMRFDLKVNTLNVADGYLRVSTDSGSGWNQWATWDDIETYPSTFEMPYGLWWGLRLPNLDDGWTHNNEVDVAAARVTVNP